MTSRSAAQSSGGPYAKQVVSGSGRLSGGTSNLEWFVINEAVSGRVVCTACGLRRRSPKGRVRSALIIRSGGPVVHSRG